MKKVLLGSVMFLTGGLSVALLLAGSMANEWTVNGQFSSVWTLSQYGLMPVVYAFLGIAAAGLAVAVWGVVDRRD